jgi:uncharacterized protein YecE (DUF72 family)
MKYYVGTSGWHYDHWRDDFYPKGMAKSGWLEFYSHYFPTVELNNSFYHLPSEKAFIGWRDASPPGFVFSVKVSRFITHIKRLKDTEEPVANFLSRARLLKGKLGPLLYQLPRNMKRDDRLLEDFLKILPGDVRHVFEFRHTSWFDDGVFDLLRRYNISFCIYDMPDFNTPVIATSDIAYIRFHGRIHLYGGCYSDGELGGWARKIKELGSKAVFAYFNNDAEGFAIKNALTLGNLLGGVTGKKRFPESPCQ